MRKIILTILLVFVSIASIANAGMIINGSLLVNGKLSAYPSSIVASAPFSPTDIAGLRIWLDGNDSTKLFTDSGCSTPVASNNDPVGCWKDKSGNAADVLQSTSGLRPTYKTASLNSKATVETDGAATYLTNTTFSLQSTTATIFIVAVRRETNTPNSLLSLKSTGSTFDYDNAASAVVMFVASGDYRNGGLCTQTAPADAESMIWTSKYDSANNTCYKNGGSGGTPVASTGTFSSEEVTVGKRNSENLYGGWDYAEILIYDSALSDTDRATVRDYLNTKWAAY